MVKITKVYTRTGDRGTTSLVGGVRIAKDSARIEAYGTVDELNSQLGLLASYMEEGHEKEVVERVQSDLFNLSTYLATDIAQTPLYPSALLREGETEMLEQEIDILTAEEGSSTGFIQPGGVREAALAHVARAVCRRAERRMVSLGCDDEEGIKTLRFVNRLSDYLFVLAKKLNRLKGVPEKTWSNSCK